MKLKNSFSLALLLLWPLVAQAASPDPNTGHFKNLSVTGTNSANEVVVTNGVTVGTNRWVLGPVTNGFPNVEVGGQWYQLLASNPSLSLVFSNLTAAALIVTPVPWTQVGTSLVVDMGAGSYQTNTATGDLVISCSNIAAGRTVTLDISAGSSNRNISFDTPLTNWFSATPTVIPANKVMWITLVPINGNTNQIRLSAANTL